MACQRLLKGTPSHCGRKQELVRCYRQSGSTHSITLCRLVMLGTLPAALASPTVSDSDGQPYSPWYITVVRVLAVPIGTTELVKKVFANVAAVSAVLELNQG
jgi:hypothetical protein